MLSLVLVFRSSWIAGSTLFHNKEDYIILFSFFVLFVLFVRFENLLSLNLNFFTGKRFLLFMISSLLIFSTVNFNIHELTYFKGFVRFLSYFAIFGLYFYIFPSFLIKNPFYFERFIHFLTWFGFVCAFLGIFFMLIGFHPVETYSSQLVSIVAHPNNTSMIFTFTTITTLYYYFWRRNQISQNFRKFLVLSFFVQLLSQLLTLTRAGIIGTIMGVMILLIVYYRKRVFFVLPFAIASIPIAIVGFLTAKGFDSFWSRLFLLVPAYYMIFENTQSFLWGYGFTRSLELYQTYTIAFNILEENIEDPHNSFVMLILMVGLPITLLICIFVAKYVLLGIRLSWISLDLDKRLFAGFASSLLISVMLHSFFDSELVRIEYFCMTFFLTFLGVLYFNVSNPDKFLILK